MITAAGPLTTSGLMRIAPVIPVLTVARIEDAVPLARALVDGGLRVLEVTLRSPCALEAITVMSREVPDAIVGAGTVLGANDFGRALRAGARFVVSPGLTDALTQAAASAPATPFLPGVATATEVMRGLDAGLDHFKFFPASTSGGPAALKALFGPFASCRFCPTGGVSANTAPDYLALPNVLCVGGGWVAPDEAVATGDWARVTALARAAAGLTRHEERPA
jgi:2-dehydro-3-deoxyphosphogluconate aldolase/(4S)-4-hydroxy-2-oxoglutarate aldolase